MQKREQSNIRKSHFLKPADFYFTSESMVIKTVLGSCLTITMFSRKAGAAAACHAVLPSCRDNSCPHGTCRNKYKFVKCVIPEMLWKFNRLGVGPDEIEIKMFGGADMILVKRDSWLADNERVGRKNILMAREVVQYNRLKVKNVDVGGTFSRKIHFDTETGEVWLKRLIQPILDDGMSGDNKKTH